MEPYHIPNGKEYGVWDNVFKDRQEMPFTPMNTGNIRGAIKNYTQRESLPSHYDPENNYDFAVMAFHFRHPRKGDILIDTGFDRSFYAQPPFGNLPFLIRMYQILKRIRYTQGKDEDLSFHLNEYNINPGHVFLTHMHPDHTAGMPAITDNCIVYYGKREDSRYYRLITGQHLKGKKRVYLIDLSQGISIAPFNRVIDVFGDGTFWAIATPGHTKDHIAYLVNTVPHPLLIVGDAELATWGMKEKIIVNTDYGRAGKRDAYNSANMIREFHTMYPEVKIWFAHDERHL